VLTGGENANRIDASGFTLGGLTLGSGGGLDTLVGSDQDDVFIIDVSGLSTPADENDSARQVVIAVGSSTDDTVIILGTGSTLTQAHINWVPLSCPLQCTEIFYENDSSYTLNSAISTDGKDIRIEAPTVTIKAGIDTRNSDSSTAGNITIRGERLSIENGAILNAEASTAAASGKISIQSNGNRTFMGSGDNDDKDGGFLGFANLDYIDVDVDIGDADIRGGDIEVSATADGAHYFRASDYADGTADSFWRGTVAEGIVNFFESLSLFGAVSVTTAKANVKIGTDATVKTKIRATDLTVLSHASADANASPLVALIAGVAVGVSNVESNTNLGNVDIFTANDLVVRAQGKPTVAVIADTGGVKGLGVGVAVSRIDSNATVAVGKQADLRVKGNLYVQSETVDRNRTLGRSLVDGAGKVGIAVAVSVENGTTTATLDGKAHVEGNLNVVAKHHKSALETKKLFLLPSITNGVQASSGVGVNSKGDFLDDAKSATISKAVGNWLREKILGKATKDPPAQIQVGASVAFHDDGDTATAQIGYDYGCGPSDNCDDPGDNTSAIDVAGFINVTSRTSARPDVTADATTGHDQTTLQGLKVGRPGVGIALALAVGDHSGEANAYVNRGASVDAQENITITADALNQIDPLGLFGANLLAPFLSQNTQPKNESGDGTVILDEGHTVKVASGHAAGGDAGKTYRYVGPDGAETDLAAENYSDSLKWESVDLGKDAGLNFFRTLTTYLDGNLGLDNNLVDLWSQAQSRKQEKAAIGAAVAYEKLDFDANALVRDGAKVNQGNPDFESSDTAAAIAAGDTVKVVSGHANGGEAGRTYRYLGNAGSTVNLTQENYTTSSRWESLTRAVVIEANATSHLIALGGNFETPGLTGAANAKAWSISSNYRSYGMGSGRKGEETEGAVGAAVTVLEFQNDSIATIEDNVSLYADSLSVKANTDVILVAVAVSAGAGTDLVFNGVVVTCTITNVTRAQIDDGAAIVVGDGAVYVGGESVVVAANDDTVVVNVAGAFAISGRGGIGGSVAYNSVNRTTEALIGQREEIGTPSTTGSFISGGDVLIKAANGGFIGSFGVAGSKASNKSVVEEGVTANKTAFGLSVGVGFNKVADTVRAYVASPSFRPTGDTTLSATNETTIESLSIGGSYSSGNENSIALAGAGSSNEVDSVVETFIKNSTVNTTDGAVSLAASDKSGIFAQAGSFAVANTSANPATGSTSARSLSIGLSVTVNKVGKGSGQAVRSYIDNSVVTAGGGVSLTAQAPAKLHVLAIGGSFSSARGQASVNSTLAGAAAGAYAENTVAVDVESYISGSSQIDTRGNNGSVTLTTNSKSVLFRADAFGVAAAYASGGIQNSGGLAIGVGLAFNTLKGSSKAYVDSSTVTSGGGVTISADSQPDIDALAIGVAASVARGTGTTGSLAGAGSAAKNVVDN
ncbi:MAG: hypothetical protein QGF59_09600, partial [Pirellulaceae bacterium]|nr:hypothetical protein [Pirellulaceae bacterium]